MVAAGERDADLYYGTRFASPDPVLFFRIRGRDILVLSDLEYGRGIKQARVDRVLRYSELAARATRPPHKIPDMTSVISSFLRSQGIRRVEVPAHFELGLSRAIEAKGIGVSPRTAPLFPERSRKTSGEVACIREALRATEKAIGKAEAVLRRSRIRGSRIYDGSRVVTSESLRGVLHVSMAEDGLTASHTIVACGNQACDPHSEGKGPLRAHHAIVMDVFPRSSRTLYWADITRTFVKGKARPALRAQYEAVKEAQEAAIRAVRAGIPAHRVHEAAADVFKGRGYENRMWKGIPAGFIHGTGHGVGLEIHEPPRLNATSLHRLAVGEVVTIEPGLYYPGVGGVRLEDMVVVTGRGCVNLTKYPKRFVIP